MTRIFLVLILIFGLAACAGDDGASVDPVVDQSTFLRLAEKSMAKQDYVMAMAMYQKAVAEDKNSAAAWLGLAKSMLASGNTDDALVAMKKAADLNPNEHEIKKSLAGMLIVQMHLAEAEKILLDALNDKPDAKLFNLLGIAYDLQNKSQLAVESYYAGLVLAPTDLGLLTNLGLSYGLSGKLPEGIKLLQRVTSNPSSTARQRQNLALLYVINRQPDLAKKILRMDGDESVVRQNMDVFQSIAAASPGAPRVQLLMQMPRN